MVLRRRGCFPPRARHERAPASEARPAKSQATFHPTGPLLRRPPSFFLFGSPTQLSSFTPSAPRSRDPRHPSLILCPQREPDVARCPPLARRHPTFPSSPIHPTPRLPQPWPPDLFSLTTGEGALWPLSSLLCTDSPLQALLGAPPESCPVSGDAQRLGGEPAPSTDGGQRRTSELPTTERRERVRRFGRDGDRYRRCDDDW